MPSGQEKEPSSEKEFTITEYNHARWLMFQGYKLVRVTIQPNKIYTPTYHFEIKQSTQDAWNEIQEYNKMVADEKKQSAEFQTFLAVANIDETLRKTILKVRWASKRDNTGSRQAATGNDRQ